MLKLKEIITEAITIDLITAPFREEKFVLLPETLKIVGEEFFGRDLSCYQQEVEDAVERYFESQSDVELDKVIQKIQDENKLLMGV